MTIRAAKIISALMTIGVWRLHSAEMAYDSAKLILLDQAAPSIGYVLKDNQPVMFPLPKEAQVLRLVSTPTLGGIDIPQDKTDPVLQRKWNYEIRYDFLDANKKVVQSKKSQFRAKLAIYENQNSGTFHTGAFYREQGFTPAESGFEVLDLRDLKGAINLTVTLSGHDPAIRDVLLRSYTRQEIGALRHSVEWQRKNPEQRAKISRGNLYPPELLTEREQKNVVRYHWTLLGPEGVPGKDFDTRHLFTLVDPPEIAVQRPIPPQGLLIAKGGAGVIPVPEHGGEVRVRFYATEATVLEDRHLEVHWFGATALERSAQQIPWQGDHTEFRKQLAGGMIEVQSPSEVVVKAFLRGDGGESEITPQPMSLRSYRVRPELNLHYEFAGDRTSSIPFRIDVRYLATTREATDHPAVLCEFLDGGGNVLRRAALEYAWPRSVFDRVLPPEVGEVTDPASSFFSIPPEMRTLRLSAPAAATGGAQPIITAYTRPADLPVEQRLPEDIFSHGDISERAADRLPAWFAIRPAEQAELVRQNASVVLNVQPRPPDEHPELLAGDYMWQQIFPEGSWFGRALLTVFQPNSPPRQVDLPVSYRSLPLGSDTTLDFPEYQGRHFISPILAWSKASQSMEFRVFVDERLQTKAAVHGTKGRLELGRVSAGQHRIRVEASRPAEVMINNTLPVPADRLKRVACLLDDRPLRFWYERKEAVDETISCRFFTGAEVRDRSRITVKLALPARDFGPFQTWTFPERRFDLRPASRSETVVFDKPHQELNSGQQFFVPVGADVPAGQYLLELTLAQGPSGYVILSRVTPGLTDRRSVHVDAAQEYEGSEE